MRVRWLSTFEALSHSSVNGFQLQDLGLVVSCESGGYVDVGFK